MPPLDRHEVVRHVQEVLAEVLNLDAPPALEARLVEDLGAQSVDVLALLFEFEERLGRRLPDEDVARLATVGDIVDRLLVAGPIP
jgi:acyl carrier protein